MFLMHSVIILSLTLASTAFAVQPPKLCRGSELLSDTRADEIGGLSKSPISSHLIESYFRYVVFAQGVNQLPTALEPKAFVYILDAFSLNEQARLTTLLEFCVSRLNADIAKAGDVELVQKLSALDTHVSTMKKDHKKAVALALENHDQRGQLYGDKPYSVHLRNARGVLKRFKLGPRDSLLGLELGTIMWLHDIIEDTPVTPEILKAIFGKSIADAVAALTNEPKREGLSKEDRKRITFERIGSIQKSRIAKLADRITNVEESLTNDLLGRTTKITKYYTEWPLFKEYLFREHEQPSVMAMQEHLERLLTEPDYAREFVLLHSRRR